MNKSGKCFIATAAYGSELSKEVMALKRFRDNTLINSKIGRGFIKFYYLISPLLAKKIETRPKVRAIIRYFLKPIINLLNNN